jgi:hypothetical protein
MKKLILLIGIGAFFIQWQGQKLKGKDFPKEITIYFSKAQSSEVLVDTCIQNNYKEASLFEINLLIDSKSKMY